MGVAVGLRAVEACLEFGEPILEHDAVVHSLNCVQDEGQPTDQHWLDEAGLGLAVELHELRAHAAKGLEGPGGGVVDFDRRASHLRTASMSKNVRIRPCIAPFGVEINRSGSRCAAERRRSAREPRIGAAPA